MLVRMRTIYSGPKGSCSPGGTILLDDKEAKTLIDGDYAEEVKEPKPQKALDPNLPEGLVELGKGWYELSDGEKVQGKVKAIAAQEEINEKAGD